MSPAAPAPARPHRQIDAYFGLLTLAFGVVGGLAYVPVTFYLKDRLHLGPQAMAWFTFLTAAPSYVAFLFGYLRDRFRPRHGGDRAYLLGAALLAAAAYLFLAAGRVTYARLLVSGVVLSALWQMVLTVIQAVSTAAAQRDGRTGELSAVYWIGLGVPGVLSALGSGWLAAHVTPRHTFLLVAGLTGLVALLGLWRPPAVYDGLPERPRAARGGIHAVARLIRHRPIWPAVLISSLWSVGFCGGAPVLFFLTDHVHLSGQQFGAWSALTTAGFLPGTVLYGLACRRWPLRRLLWAGTPLAVFQWAFLLIVHTPAQAYGAGAAAGLFGGFAGAAYWDLLMRSAPGGLEGTAMTLGGAAATLAGVGSNLVGASIYAHGGFALSVGLTVLVYALIFPALRLVPRSVTAVRDGAGTAAPAAAEA